MKYEVLKYFKFLKERVLKWLILFILLLIIYLIIKISNSFKTFDDITKLLIIFNFKDKDFIVVLLNLFQFFLIIYIGVAYLIYEMDTSFEFVSLRIKRRKKILYSLSIVLLFNIVLRSIYYLIFKILFSQFILFDLSLYLSTILPSSLLIVIEMIIFSIYKNKKM
ncbi:MAG: hypothetical protein MR266_00640 [Erysipelotrichaceae bacterium]|nr:hypothetical protein [Erysipelotrichaceae bacterium]